MPFWCRMYPGTGYNWPWSTFPKIKNAIHKLQRTPPSRNGVTAEHGFEVSHWMIPHQWLISQRQQRAIFRQLANELSCRWSGESDPKIAGRGWIKFDIAGSTAKLSGPTTSPKILKTRTFPWREWLWANSARKTSVGIDKINAITEEPIVIEPFSVAQKMTEELAHQGRGLGQPQTVEFWSLTPYCRGRQWFKEKTRGSTYLHDGAFVALRPQTPSISREFRRGNKLNCVIVTIYRRSLSCGFRMRFLPWIRVAKSWHAPRAQLRVLAKSKQKIRLLAVRFQIGLTVGASR